MTTQKSKVLEFAGVMSLFFLGLFFRLRGISALHSFWADESYVASIAKSIVQKNISLLDGFSLVAYQRMSLLTITLSFKIFGVNEWSARFPFVLISSIGIVIAYYLAKKISNIWGGVMSSLLIAFSQVSLSQSTQAKPYTTIFTLIMLSHLLLLELYEKKSKKHIFALHFLIILTNIICTLFNYIGVIVWVPYLVFLLKRSSGIFANKKMFFLFFSVFISLVILLRIPFLFLEPVSPKYNWFVFFNDLFFRQYLVFVIPATLGVLSVKNKEFVISVILQFLLLFTAWTFFKDSHNIRYIYPLLGYSFVFCGSFCGWSIPILFPKTKKLILLFLVVILFVSGYKIVRKPSVYYSPNSDLIGDVQNADYKSFFEESYRVFPQLDSLPIFVGPFDTLSFYTNSNPKALFSINTPNPIFVPAVKSMQYGTLADFKTEQLKYSKGLVIVNDWQSYMPDEIKQYVKNNLKFELRVESLRQSPGDAWPLTLYSWGFN